ncbi:vanadium-dependent haloperoxidase [Hoeflea sp.]|uniref:vanadium-dependent haloperoxidase n=1 Tax=Hoeflea sp. TaxID=1940281 RepID=UPI003BB0BFA0
MMFPDTKRREKAKKQRIAAAKRSATGEHPAHIPNNDESDPYIFSFTKGMSHETNGLLKNPADFVAFKAGTEDHDPNTFAKVMPHREAFPGVPPAAFKNPLDAYRRWESPTAGHAYVLQGPDPFAVTMPPAPKAGSAEFAAEMAEVYQMALGREWSVAACMHPSLVKALPASVSAACKKQINTDHTAVNGAAETLSQMKWFAGEIDDGQGDEIKCRRRFNTGQHPGNIFRGHGEDAWDTPFLSQFMVMGSGGMMRDPQKRAEGFIQYGAQKIEQAVRVATPDTDYMTTWIDWLNVQNGLNTRKLLAPGKEFVAGAYRPITTLRDLATYVHDDQLYQAYFNAALILLDEGYPIDPGIPYHGKSDNKFAFPGATVGDTNRMPFALFGGPHLLTLVTEVSSRALKAVRLQKFSVHRRLRPEAAGALFHTVFTGYHPHKALNGSTMPYASNGMSVEAAARLQLSRTIAPYTHPYDANGKPQGSEPALDKILSAVLAHNTTKNGGDKTWLLPMAFPEGSPMHPSYGAGHATVAGACVTLLKAFFAMTDPGDPGKPVYLVEPKDEALVPVCKGPNGTAGELVGIPIPKGLTLQGELNKLMWNISNARNIAGVHYYSDYIESALLGEAITIGILREQMVAYHSEEKVSMTVPLLVPRTLPACLIGDSNIEPNEIVRAVRILPNGTLVSV